MSRAASLLALLALACQAPDARVADDETSAAWARARALWHIDRDPAAYGAWRDIDPATPEGREARRLLAEAEPVYREGIRQVRAGDPAARESLERGVRIAPMNPELYLPLARAFRTRGRESPENPHLFLRAAEYYRKFLVLQPDHPEAAAAQAELREIDPDGTRPFEARQGEAEEIAAPPPDVGDATPSWPLAVALAALVLAFVAVGLLVGRRRAARLPLAELATRRPELHPAIAYLVGSLRHELLKHRIGAVGGAVEALEGGGASEAQRDFLRTRLFGGEPLARAWEGHLGAFERALGAELDLLRDPLFRNADRAIRRIVALEPALRRADPRAARELARAHERLRALDGHVAAMIHRLVRTPVDGALLRDVVDEVRTEYAAGQVALDEVVIRAPEPAPLVEVFRVDLVLVLKNVVRNAILAVGDDDPPRRIGLNVETEVELTGEETVRIRVADTSHQRFSTADLYGRELDRGLGLVTAALRRYDGAITVDPPDGAFEREGFAKVVTVRFFRAFADD